MERQENKQKDNPELENEVQEEEQDEEERVHQSESEVLKGGSKGDSMRVC